MRTVCCFFQHFLALFDTFTPLLRAMTSAENSLNELHEAGNKFCRPQLLKPIKESDANHFQELLKTLCSMHCLSPALWTIADIKAEGNGPKPAEGANLKGQDDDTKVYIDANDNIEPAYVSQNKSWKQRGRLQTEDTQVLCI